MSPAPYRPDANVSPAAAEQESDKGEHWYGQLRPWEHFIPVQADLSDLEVTPSHTPVPTGHATPVTPYQPDTPRP